MTLTWKPGDFAFTYPGVADCVTIGSRISTTLTQVHSPAPAGGTDTFTYVVPPNGTGGQQICDRGLAWGRDDRGGGGGEGDGRGYGRHDEWGVPLGAEKSAVLCYTILGAAAPEAPKALLFPLAGLAVGGGALLYARRRRAAAPPRP